MVKKIEKSALLCTRTRAGATYAREPAPEPHMHAHSRAAARAAAARWAPGRRRPLFLRQLSSQPHQLVHQTVQVVDPADNHIGVFFPVHENRVQGFV